MKEYQKIETLFEFNNKTKKFINNKFRNPIVHYLKDVPWFCTEKVDGMNIRVFWDGHTLAYGGRTDNAVLPKEVVELLNLYFLDQEAWFEQNFGNKEVLFFMEAYGGKIQGGIYPGFEQLIGFDIMIDNIYLDKDNAYSLFEQFGLRTVPFIGVMSLEDAIENVKNNPNSFLCEEVKMEGFVCTPLLRLNDHKGDRIIVKIKVKDLENMENKYE